MKTEVSFDLPKLFEVATFQTNQAYKRNDLLKAGFRMFKPGSGSALVFIKEGSVYFFEKDPECSNQMRFILSSNL